MRFLHDNKYEVITINRAINIIEKFVGDNLKEVSSAETKYAVITFDDGFRDFYAEAFPVLNRYGFIATVYLATGFIGNDTRKIFKNKECLTWNEVRELSRQGIAFGSHTITHPKLVDLKEYQIENEIKNSKEEIEYKLGAAVKSFSYPYAFPDYDSEFTKKIKESLEKCGYENGVCTKIGTFPKPNYEKYFLSRIPTNSCDDFKLFKAKLECGYEWLQVPQILSKKYKAKMSLFDNDRR